MASLAKCGFIALDGIAQREILFCAERLQGHAYGIKVEGAAFHGTISMREFLGELKQMGFAVFADAKIYRRPPAAADEVAALAWCGADFITVHASGGREMLEASIIAFRAAHGQAPDGSTPGKGILALTVLTSDNRLSGPRLESEVLRLAEEARFMEAYGVICSPLELPMLKKRWRNLKCITPGIEFEDLGNDKHARSDTPVNALTNGAHQLVIGTAITDGWDPSQMVERIHRINASIAHLP